MYVVFFFFFFLLLYCFNFSQINGSLEDRTYSIRRKAEKDLISDSWLLIVMG